MRSYSPEYKHPMKNDLDSLKDQAKVIRARLRNSREEEERNLLLAELIALVVRMREGEIQ